MGLSLLFVLWPSPTAANHTGTIVAIPISGLPAGQVIVATGLRDSGTLSCGAYAFNGLRQTVIVGHGPEKVYWQPEARAGSRASVVGAADGDSCMDATGVTYFVYNVVHVSQ